MGWPDGDGDEPGCSGMRSDQCYLLSASASATHCRDWVVVVVAVNDWLMFFWQIRSLQTWADQVEAEMNQDEVVRDVTSVTSRLQLHQQLKAEIDARDDTFTTVAENGQLMIDAGHFAASDVRFVVPNSSVFFPNRWTLCTLSLWLSGHWTTYSCGFQNGLNPCVDDESSVL